MPTARPFAYNTGSPIPGTLQIGDLAIGVDPLEYSTNPGGVQWWNGPDEDLGYVIAHPTSAGNQPNPLGVPAYLGFWRSEFLTEVSFIGLAEYVSNQHGDPQTFLTGSSAKTWLNNNGYWTSYVSFVTSGLILNYDISNSSSYPGSGTIITDLQGNSNATTFNSPTYTSSGGGYLTFNGSNQYFRTNTALGSKLNPANSSTIISIFVWVYPMDNGVIVQEIGQTTPNTGWHDSQIEMVSGTLRFSVWQNQPGFASTISTPLNNWYYVGFTYDGTNLRGYVNGSLSVTSGTISRSTPGANLYYAIAHNDGTNLGDGSFANMRFGGMQVYNTALSTNDVLNNYNSTYSRFI
jgi:hypothetical protein